MNNDIKEILDNVKKCCDITKDQSFTVYQRQDILVLLDNITNLQEENDILKRDIEAMKHNYNLLVRIIENGESMTQKFENGLTYQDYKSRNEKAIEKLESTRIFGLSCGKTLFSTLINEVIDILKGE